MLAQLTRCPSRALPQEEHRTPPCRFQAPEADLNSPLPHPLGAQTTQEAGKVLWGKPGRSKDGGPRLGRMEHTVWGGSKTEDL